MPRGGKRPGAGRPKGSATKKTRKVADQAAAEGITPLEVMLDAMRRLHKARRYSDAAAVAKDAAPYVHPRLGSVVVKGPGKDGDETPLTIRFVDSPRAADGTDPPGD